MEKDKVFVSGISPQSYFVLRLVDKSFKDVYFVSSEKKCAYYSKVGNKILVNDYASYIKFLIETSEKNKLFICSGRDIQSLIEENPDFFKNKNVFPNDKFGLEYFTNKSKTYELCKELKLPIIDSWLLNEFTPELFNEQKMIAKWNVENTTGELEKFKTAVFSSKTEFEKFKCTIPVEFYNRIIVQKYIESSVGSNISFLGLYSKGSLIAGMLAQQLEQYPQGITSYLVEYDGPLSDALIYAAKKLISGTSYNGFCEVEFKLDSSFTSFYILEVNPRPCGWSSALLGKYSNLDKLLIDSSVKPIILNNKTSWINILRFLRGRLNKGIIELLKGISLVPFVSCYDIFSLKDLKPFVSQFFTWKK